MGNRKMLLVAAMLATALTTAWSGLALARTTTPNLIENGGAQNAPSRAPWESLKEAGYGVFCTADDSLFKTRRYTQSDVPIRPGSNFGTHLFSGNNAAGDIGPKCMGQLIDLRPYKTRILTGNVDWMLSAWMGVAGGDDTDEVGAAVCFYESGLIPTDGCPQGIIVVAGPTSDRLLLMTRTGGVPPEARFVAVLFYAIERGTNRDGRNRGCFDNARFKLSWP